MPSSKTCHGLPWFEKHEKFVLHRQGYACIYAAGEASGRPLYIGRTQNLPERMTGLKTECSGDFAIHYVLWTQGDLPARRIMVEAEAILDRTKRRLRSNLFDLTPNLAEQVILLAADKAGVGTLSHDQMLTKLRAIRRADLEAVVSAYGTIRRVDWEGFEDARNLETGARR